MSKKMRGDLGQAFAKFKEEWFITHRNTIWEKVPGGYKWEGHVCKNKEEMDAVIDEVYSKLEASISKRKNKLHGRI